MISAKLGHLTELELVCMHLQVISLLTREFFAY